VDRRALVVVSVIAIAMLGSIALALTFVDNGSANGPTAEPVPVTGAEFDGVRFEDPQGTYRIDVAPEWRIEPSAGAGTTEVWRVGRGTGPAVDRVEIATEDVGETDLDQYLQLVFERAPSTVVEFKLREFRVVGNGNSPPIQLGVVAYEGRLTSRTTPSTETNPTTETTDTTGTTGIFLVVGVEDGVAVVARYTTTREDFADARAEVEPYLLTLRPIRALRPADR
jgi:hypothetical protein